MSAGLRRPTRPQPVPWHRMVFGLLIVIIVAAPLAIWILVIQGQAHDATQMRNLLRIWTIAVAAILVWAAVYVTREPQLVRVAVTVIGFLFVILAVFGRFNATPSGARPVIKGGSATEPAGDARGSDSHIAKNAATPSPAVANNKPKSANPDDVTGVWITPEGYAWTFSEDRTFKFRADKGHWSKSKDQFVAFADDGVVAWKMKLSPDGQKLSGTWSTTDNQHGVIELIRSEAEAEQVIKAASSAVTGQDTKTLFQDDFKTGAAWQLPKPPAATIADGKLILQADPDVGLNAMHPGQSFGDMSASVNIAILGETDETAAGMVFWTTSSGAALTVLISSVQTIGVYQWTGSERVILSQWKSCRELKPGLKQVNNLKIVTRGNQITIHINGNDALTVTGSPPSGGGLVGLRISAPAKAKASAAFSDFRVTK